jgi:hypothetical protein
MRKPPIATALLLIGACLGGCGSPSHAADSGVPDGSSGFDAGNIAAAAQCPAPAPCGGDLSGSWKLVSACLDYTAPSGVPCTAPTISGSGQLTATISGCSLMTQASDTTVTLDYPPSCRNGNCYDLQVGWFGGTSRPVLCSSDGMGGCACNVSDGSNSGGGSICTEKGGSCACPDGGSPNPDSAFDYCVDGTTLTLMRIGSMAFPYPAVFVFTR